MSSEPVPRASRPRAPAAHAGPPRANHARYLVVLALSAFALPALARALEALGAPRTPAGVPTLLLAVILLVAILTDRSPADPLVGPPSAVERPARSRMVDPEERDARV